MSPPAARGALIRLVRRDGDGSNSVAAAALRLDREVGLVRYHGPGPYLRDRYRRLVTPRPWSGVLSGGEGSTPLWLRRVMYGTSRSSADDTSVGGDSGSPTDFSGSSGGGAGRGHGTPNVDSEGRISDGAGDGDQKKRARVAFMITSSQRLELRTALGYEPADIKRLKPLEALLVLEHGLRPGSDDDLRSLVRDNEELQRTEAEGAMREEQRRREETKETAPRSADEAESGKASQARLNHQSDLLMITDSAVESKPRPEAASGGNEPRAARGVEARPDREPDQALGGGRGRLV